MGVEGEIGLNADLDEVWHTDIVRFRDLIICKAGAANFLRFVLSHPCRDETASRMGHPASIILPSVPSESRPGRFGIYGGRNVPDAAALMRMALAYAVSDLSLSRVPQVSILSIKPASAGGGSKQLTGKLLRRPGIAANFMPTEGAGAFRPLNAVAHVVGL